MFGELNLNKRLRIVRFSGDTLPSKESFDDLKDVILECEDLYPGIDKWYKKKVEPGVRAKDRIAFVIYNKEQPIAAAVLRKGKNAKLCSMRILADHREKGLGKLLISLIAKEIRDQSKKIHFTAPLQVWSKWEKFFASYGFVNNGPASVQYRLFEEELGCSANFQDLWNAVIRKLPSVIEHFTLNGNTGHSDIVFSIHPEHIQKIISGQKRVEIRRKFSNKWKGASALLYASSPRREFVGEALIGEIITDSPKNIWSNWAEGIGCSADEFASYCKGLERVSAIIFADVNLFKQPILHSQLEHLLDKDLKPPQSYCEVKKDSIWPTALSLTYLLQSSL
jgi:predicted transcriptional regulator/N-acetylglutamate synthase-like GNAT family acetyltransferase